MYLLCVTASTISDVILKISQDQNHLNPHHPQNLSLTDYFLLRGLQIPKNSRQVIRNFLRNNNNKKDSYRQLNVRQLGSLRPWNHRGKCYIDRKKIQFLSNASQHVPIYLQPFLRYSSISVSRYRMGKGGQNFGFVLFYTPHILLHIPQASSGVPHILRRNRGLPPLT